MNNMRDAILMEELTDLPCDLRFINAKKSYPDFTLNDVSFGVPAGSVVGLIGRNGAGKTTLMKAAMGVISLDGGVVELFGTNASSLSDAELLAMRNRIGYVSAVMAFPVEMTVADVAHLYSLAFSSFSDKEFLQLCDRLGLTTATRKVKDLSRGMGMKLQLACALASGTDLLVLDEPTAGLDPIVRDEVLELLYEWSRATSHSIFISSHITSDLDYLADHLIMLEEGEIVLACSRSQLDTMGIVRLGEGDLARVKNEPSLMHGSMRLLRRGHNVELLVPDAKLVSTALPDLHLLPASIDDVMTLVARGEVI